jgi:hypothetical protein
MKNGFPMPPFGQRPGPIVLRAGCWWYFSFNSMGQSFNQDFIPDVWAPCDLKVRDFAR